MGAPIADVQLVIFDVTDKGNAAFSRNKASQPQKPANGNRQLKN
jgi:hypothetical protein